VCCSVHAKSPSNLRFKPPLRCPTLFQRLRDQPLLLDLDVSCSRHHCPCAVSRPRKFKSKDRQQPNKQTTAPRSPAYHWQATWNFLLTVYCILLLHQKVLNLLQNILCRRNLTQIACSVFGKLNVCHQTVRRDLLNAKKKLDVIQHKALHIACLAFCSTAAAALQVETGELPLDLRAGNRSWNTQ